MPRHPSVYADMLREKIERHGTRCWLVNTGWTGGGYGAGRRMPLAATRAMLTAVLSGELGKIETKKEPAFGLDVPTHCPGVDDRLLMPRATWPDKAAYDRAARDVAGRFARNFEKYAEHVDARVERAGIAAAA